MANDLPIDFSSSVSHSVYGSFYVDSHEKSTVGVPAMNNTVTTIGTMVQDLNDLGWNPNGIAVPNGVTIPIVWPPLPVFVPWLNRLAPLVNRNFMRQQNYRHGKHWIAASVLEPEPEMPKFNLDPKRKIRLED